MTEREERALALPRHHPPSVDLDRLTVLVGVQRLAVQEGNNISTPKITEGGQLGVIVFEGSTTPLYSLVALAAIVGVLYALMLSRTVFGFSIKATGMSESAAIASGISVKRMIVSAMQGRGRQ